MQHTAIVPERNTAPLPLEPARKLRLGLPLVQKLQQTLGFLLRPSVEPARVRGVDVQRFAAGFRVRAHYGVDGFECLRLLLGVGGGVLDAVFAGFGGVGFAGGGDGAEGGEGVLEGQGEGFVC